MIIYDALKKDHIELKALLEKLVNTAAGSRQRKQAVKAVQAEIVPHTRAEESIFYNYLREIKNDELKELVMGHGFGEHIQAENLLNGLLKDDLSEEDLASEFKQAVEHHIEEEEGEVFTAAQEVLSNDEAMMLGNQFEELKEKIKAMDDEKMLEQLIANMLPLKFHGPGLDAPWR